DGGGLLRGDVSGTKTEAQNPVREAADHFAALLWHPALPILCARRRDQENSLSVQSQSARRTTAGVTARVDAGLGKLKNEESPGCFILDNGNNRIGVCT